MGFTIARRVGRPISRRVLAALLALICLSLLLAPRSAGAQIIPTGDVGDAPDSTNHSAGVQMAAYPMIPARYPTVFDAAVGAVQGPYHASPKANGWLGANVSRERDADQLPDGDGLINIDPPANSANRDGFDDGVLNNLALPQCQTTQFFYQITGAAAVPAPQGRVNVWFDWNRDGDWQDQLTCTVGGVAKTVNEWAVVNQPVNIVAGNTVVWVTPQFVSYHAEGDLWMRISLANTVAPLNPNTLRADGRGPGGGYQYGETEDYRLVPLGNGFYEPCDDMPPQD